MEFAYVYALGAALSLGGLAAAYYYLTLAPGPFTMLRALAGLAAGAGALCFPTATAGALTDAVGSLADAAEFIGVNVRSLSLVTVV